MSNSIENQISPHVNSALLPHWVGKTVRLTCKTIKFNDNGSLTVAAADGGQVSVRVTQPSALQDDPALASSYLEIVGKVVDASTIQMLGCVAMGSDLDMKLINDTISIIHDDRYFTKMFSY
ncbi:hypothetical protein FA15DRAFT_674703 [Coprinopsis marcescibilis]|uniref:Replication factor A protein 3 n=1 Tax=Coprinopsis marcescibilis TaxID=230819 RepID=A0A5C3KHD9_COPMA|nr:hypothetical protein FA15DRAFT_674703 [Coprinopsis marcescibilis]